MSNLYHLNSKELAKIEKAILKDKRPEVRDRATALRLLHLGHEPEQVANQHLVTVATLYKWHRLWREGGIEGLANKAPKGRPPKANEAYFQKLEELLKKSPSEFGYDAHTWTLVRLRTQLEKETGVLMSERRFRALLKMKGYR